MGEQRTNWTMTESEEEIWNRLFLSAKMWNRITNPIQQNLPYPIVETRNQISGELMYAVALEIDALHRRIDKIEEKMRAGTPATTETEEKMVDTVHPTGRE